MTRINGTTGVPRLFRYADDVDDPNHTGANSGY